MIQRLLVACLGVAVVLGLLGMGQASKRGKPRPSAPASQARETPDAAPGGESKAQQKDRDPKAGKDQGEAKDDGKDAKAAKEEKPKLAKATFGGGCFWCMEAVFERIPGVKSVVSGFAGGHVPNPTYQMVCTGLTGHAEVVQITYDPSVVSFEKLLDVFWISHDPTTLNSQGPDYGTQYRSIILYHDEDQRAAAIKSYKEQKARRGRRPPIVTELAPLNEFYPAEEYHQDYYRNHPDADYSQMYIEPKLHKLRSKLK